MSTESREVVASQWILSYVLLLLCISTAMRIAYFSIWGRTNKGTRKYCVTLTRRCVSVAAHVSIVCRQLALPDEGSIPMSVCSLLHRCVVCLESLLKELSV